MKVLKYLASKLNYALVSKTDLRNQDKYLDKLEFRYILWLDRIYSKIATVPGHIIELGVARGRNSIIFGNLIQLNGDDEVRMYYGFDTFEGYDEKDYQDSPYLNKNDWKNSSKEFVEQRVTSAGLAKNLQFIEGDIKKTLPSFLEETNTNRFIAGHIRIALLYVDCNAYLPAITGMELAKNYMSPGGVICIDEKKQGGETKALIEFCQKYNLEFIKDSSPFSIPAYTVIK